MLYSEVIEIDERVDIKGKVLRQLNHKDTKKILVQAFNKGFKSIAIVLLHGYRYQEHEKQISLIAKDIGFTQISVSHQISPLMKIIPRGDTTVVDAYLSPILRRYVNQVRNELGPSRSNFGR